MRRRAKVAKAQDGARERLLERYRFCTYTHGGPRPVHDEPAIQSAPAVRVDSVALQEKLVIVPGQYGMAIRRAPADATIELHSSERKKIPGPLGPLT